MDQGQLDLAIQALAWALGCGMIGWIIAAMIKVLRRTEYLPIWPIILGALLGAGWGAVPFFFPTVTNSN